MSSSNATPSQTMGSESKNTDYRRGCKSCPVCGVTQNSNTVKFCKACKHKFVFKNEKPSSKTKKCGKCGK